MTGDSTTGTRLRAELQQRSLSFSVAVEEERNNDLAHPPRVKELSPTPANEKHHRETMVLRSTAKACTFTNIISMFVPSKSEVDTSD
ncbi:hypothetical protein BX616_004866 [Lobosporangium transversale]|nr:hypothetical protein BX616_004866 [Lobosporangium transversale]